ncbi:sensor histidine kinase [Cupriavidus agavae]|uniref:histidine kinase n=1 Tax=Cupriavidus agavae TaxID=1001822 RepID=A0A4Q7R9J7_9BURK|nr:ATP-binding protein [Cupriavidus agavae]RZT29017.1 phospho-acceptor domain-containing protein [Cupriavidus agavae]
MNAEPDFFRSICPPPGWPLDADRHGALAHENARLRESLARQATRLDETEHKLRHAQAELARANRLSLYGELVASIVHEVAQPVTALDSAARAGLRWLERDEPNVARAREALTHISACANRARTIIESLRARAREDAPGFAVFDLGASLREVADLATHTFGAMKVTLRLDPRVPPLPVRGERVLLQQAILNLLMNGAEAMQDRPEGQRELVLDWELAGDSLRIHVDDRGEGFDPALAERVFEPLFTTKPSGMGMGLAISRSIVQAHQGQLLLAPRPDGGTRATLTLPRTAA